MEKKMNTTIEDKIQLLKFYDERHKSIFYFKRLKIGIR